ncbi:aminodeoxychorismate synthase component I [Cupriavidus sp. RAF12]|uniref:aminodeoxychorismate synthase component I n=1 Tax=Cupriavidus sp. RAF12 TaxID=3233050 RepID=UPI003F8E8E22
MTICRFENTIAKRALALYGLRRRIEAYAPSDVPTAMAAIEASRQQGHWIALILSYSLGEWLEPALARQARTSSAHSDEPRLTALVFERAETEAVWHPPEVGQVSQIVSACPRISFATYKQRLEKIRCLIEEGNVYQVNYTFPIDVEIVGDPVALYRTLINRHPAAHAAYIRIEGQHILSFSPELFLCRKDGRVTSRPMKGTAPRYANAIQDQRSARALLASVKDRAENAMIVDLLRNDLGKIARVGSVTVERLFELERYPSIWTMTSTISADIGQTSLLDVLRALFPCGSITGAPKIAAMRYIHELEGTDRGLYCGSIGWLAPNGDFSLNVAIRTLLLNDKGSGVYGVGGGIVLDSDPELEWQECQWKSRILEANNARAWTRDAHAAA